MPSGEESEVPIYMEWMLRGISQHPFMLENLCAFIRRITLENNGLNSGEVKISFPKKTSLGTLINVTWWNEDHQVVKEFNIRWPDGGIICPCCKGQGEFRFWGGIIHPCKLCYGEGITGNVNLEPEMDDFTD